MQFFILIITFFSVCYAQKSQQYSINIVGFFDDIRSISRHTSSFIECLRKDADITFIKTRPCNFKDLPDYFERITNTGIDLTNKKITQEPLRTEKKITGITIYTDTFIDGWQKYLSICNESTIKIAYCVTERTLIPHEWAGQINKNFDAIVVADGWLVDVYKNSGVSVPIFTLPLALDLESLLKKPIKQACNKPFVFGFSGGFWARKNHELLVKAFVAEFGNNHDIILKMHGRFESGFSTVLKELEKIKTPNIMLEYKAFTRQEYENFITSLDCYVLVSKAEGFSITPREALASGIPCILSNNTAHKVICDAQCVYAVPANIPEPSYCNFARRLLGYDFNCTIKDVRKALRDVYENYQEHLIKANIGRTWVQQYHAENLKQKYMNLVRPKMVILGANNSITHEHIVTNSKTLFNKYQQLCKSTDTIFKTFQDKA